MCDSLKCKIWKYSEHFFFPISEKNCKEFSKSFFFNLFLRRFYHMYRLALIDWCLMPTLAVFQLYGGGQTWKTRRIEEVNNIRISCSEYTYKTISQTIHLTQFNIILLI